MALKVNWTLIEGAEGRKYLRMNWSVGDAGVKPAHIRLNRNLNLNMNRRRRVA